MAYHFIFKQSLLSNNDQKVNTLRTCDSVSVAKLLSPLKVWLVALSLSGGISTSHADMALTLEWDDLIPPESRAKIIESQAPAIDHNSDSAPQNASPAIAEINMALNGKFVKLAGYMVPLDGHDNKVTAFLLVPYFGACIHVPPPPANQIVYVEYKEGVDADTIYDPVWISGPLQAGKVSTEMAETGYSMMADSIVPYDISSEEPENR